jgi:glycosyltransferase involved in cell wall biosynthesis
MPVYNEEAHVGPTIRDVERAAASASLLEVDIVVVDDGSVDGTAQAAEQAAQSVPLTMVRQPNRGRFAARRRGLEDAQGEYVLFLDGRVRLHSEALRFVESRLRDGETVWNGHCEIAADGNPFGLFWRGLTDLAFADYFANPRTTSFDAASFDRFPKGTTCFLAPRELLIAAFDSFRSSYSDLRHANDDTPIIRWIAERTPVRISPSFRCVYRPRTTLRAFLRHAFHRGTVFVDGHGRRESRFFPLVVTFFPMSAAFVALSLRRPAVVPLTSAGIGATVSVAAAVQGRPREEVVSLGLLSPVYAAAHGAGMWRGLLLLARGRLR